MRIQNSFILNPVKKSNTACAYKPSNTSVGTCLYEDKFYRCNALKNHIPAFAGAIDMQQVIADPEDFHFNLPHDIDDILCTGGQPKLSGIKHLSDTGVGTIINLRYENQGVGEGFSKTEEAEAARQLGIKFVNIPLKADKPPTIEDIRRFYEAIANSGSKKVFVHCYHGKDRTGIMSAIYLHDIHDFSYPEAWKHMMKHKHSCKMYPELGSFLKDYYRNPGMSGSLNPLIQKIKAKL